MSASKTSMSAGFKVYQARVKRIGATPKYGTFAEWAASPSGVAFANRHGLDVDSHTVPVADATDVQALVAQAVAQALASLTPDAPAPKAAKAAPKAAAKAARTDGLPSLPKGFAFGKVYANGKGEARCTLLIPAAQAEAVAAAIRAL